MTRMTTCSLLLLAFTVWGCDPAVDKDNGGGDTDTDTDADSDTDADTDTDADSDSDTDTGLPAACDCEADVAVTALDENGGFCGPHVFDLAQSFVPTVSSIGEVELFLCEQGVDLPAHTLWLHADDEGAPANVGLASVEIDPGLCVYPEFEPICVDFGDVEVTGSQTHWLILEFGGEFDEDNFCQWATTAEDTYGLGYAAIESATGWTPLSEVVTEPQFAHDFVFRVCAD